MHYAGCGIFRHQPLSGADRVTPEFASVFSRACGLLRQSRKIATANRQLCNGLFIGANR
ncbi:hypothetical protein KL86DES1_21742 [uncultured Desulfovibrio sp.]|uniref:Uncharacterized protein n=1 Tax=uncultured Desulfovibrio sp. TaxID=167968 RepID=A0A212L9G1_9BACT|nr:hypothetical protein KL86DES1_21742 [uncultured Desulfovibrio sp.]VZH34646.1 conserved protein of unknown function [Desulfovibrio sp. 86]